MIPTVVVVGALVRKWWVIAAGALLWPIVVAVAGDVAGVGGFVGAGLLGAANAAVGAVGGSLVWNLVGRGAGRRRWHMSG